MCECSFIVHFTFTSSNLPAAASPFFYHLNAFPILCTTSCTAADTLATRIIREPDIRNCRGKVSLSNRVPFLHFFSLFQKSERNHKNPDHCNSAAAAAAAAATDRSSFIIDDRPGRFCYKTKVKMHSPSMSDDGENPLNIFYNR